MEYKTTYFKIPLNSEISVSEEDYKYRVNNEKLNNEIKELESFLEKTYLFNSSNLELSNLENYLQDENHSRNEIIKKRVSELIYLKRILNKLSNQRFTKEYEQDLNNHLNENAKKGWKLFSMNPITKGLKQYDFDSNVKFEKGYNFAYGHGYGYGYGYGHNILEGFILVWERIG